MAHQDIEGWPLGLRPLNARVGGLMRNLDFSAGSISFNTLLTSSPTITTSISSSDLDTESVGSFFHDKSKTLGSLIGVSSILEISRRSTRGRTDSLGLKDKKPKPWLFSLCSKLTTDAVIATNRTNTQSSLGHFLEAERRAVSTTASFHGRADQSHLQYGHDDYSTVNLAFSGSNPLFVNGVVAPHPSAASGVASDGTKSNAGLLEDGNVIGVPLLFPRLCGQLLKR